MTGCFSWLLLLIGFIFLMATMIRWFEQTAEAVDNRWWNKVLLLVLFPFSVWFFPARVSAGRPVPVALHQPVMGMGAAPKPKFDEPPPGTPKEFLGMPKIPPKKVRSAPAVDPDKLAKLKEKMRQQGMLRDDADQPPPQ